MPPGHSRFKGKKHQDHPSRLCIGSFLCFPSIHPSIHPSEACICGSEAMGCCNQTGDQQLGWQACSTHPAGDDGPLMIVAPPTLHGVQLLVLSTCSWMRKHVLLVFVKSFDTGRQHKIETLSLLIILRLSAANR